LRETQRVTILDFIKGILQWGHEVLGRNTRRITKVLMIRVFGNTVIYERKNYDI